MDEGADFFDWLKLRLALDLPGHEAQRKMMPLGRQLPKIFPENTKKSAVLVTLYPEEEQLKLILIERTVDGHFHSGQIAFPGGRMEDKDASLQQTALREAHEEIGLKPRDVSVLGALTPVYIPVSNFEVFPFVGICTRRPRLTASEMEVAAILHFSIPFDFRRKKEERFWTGLAPQDRIIAPAYFVQGRYAIWGATAMMLSEMEVLWMEFVESRQMG